MPTTADPEDDDAIHLTSDLDDEDAVRFTASEGWGWRRQLDTGLCEHRINDGPWHVAQDDCRKNRCQSPITDPRRPRQ